MLSIDTCCVVSFYKISGSSPKKDNWIMIRALGFSFTFIRFDSHKDCRIRDRNAYLNVGLAISSELE